MKTIKKNVKGGVYLVVDPAMEREVLLEKLKQALDGGLAALQVWNNWPEEFTLKEKENLVSDIKDLASGFEVPVLINEEWQFIKTTELDGVHFDRVPGNYYQIISELGRDVIYGITCSNDLNIIRWAEDNNLDYISFCAMFPSPSVASCEIVRHETVQKAREITNKPLFVSGGITSENLPKLRDLDINGVAVISGIMSAESPGESIHNYQKALNKLRSEA